MLTLVQNQESPSRLTMLVNIQLPVHQLNVLVKNQMTIVVSCTKQYKSKAIPSASNMAINCMKNIQRVPFLSMFPIPYNKMYWCTTMMYLMGCNCPWHSYVKSYCLNWDQVPQLAPFILSKKVATSFVAALCIKGCPGLIGQSWSALTGLHQ